MFKHQADLEMFTNKKHRFSFTTISDQLRRAEEGAITNWLIPGLLVEGGSTLIYAPPASGKSLIAMDLSIAATHGRKWMNVYEFAEPMAVLYLDDDGNNDHEFNSRLLQFGVDENNDKMHCLLHNNVDITNDEQRAALLCKCQENCIRLIIADSLTRLHRRSENNSDEMKIVNACLKEFCAVNITVVMLHHSVKSGKTFRGSSEITAAYDTVFRMEKRDDKRFALVNEKARSVGEGGIWAGCEIVVTNNAEGHLVLDGSQPLGNSDETASPPKTQTDIMRSQIIDLLCESELNATAIKKTLKLSSRDYPAFDSCMETLVSEQLISAVKRGKGTFYALCLSEDNEVDEDYEIEEDEDSI